MNHRQLRVRARTRNDARPLTRTSARPTHSHCRPTPLITSYHSTYPSASMTSNALWLYRVVSASAQRASSARSSKMAQSFLQSAVGPEAGLWPAKAFRPIPVCLASIKRGRVSIAINVSSSRSGVVMRQAEQAGAKSQPAQPTLCGTQATSKTRRSLVEVALSSFASLAEESGAE